MKRNEFLKILADHGVFPFRNGSKHDIFRQSGTGKKIAVPRHGEIDNKLVRRILKEIRDAQ